MLPPQQSCQNVPTCTCSTCKKHHCPDCDQSFNDFDGYILHLQKSSHKKHPCGYCHVHFLHRSGLIQHYESGSCRSQLNRHTIREGIRQADKARLITNPTHPLIEPPPALVTQQSWDEHTQRYKCYLCNPAKHGFKTLEAINAHIVSVKHEAKSYKCPHSLCHKPFNTIGGLVQHIESRSCQCLTVSNRWSAYLGIMPGPWKPDRIVRESRISTYLSIEEEEELEEGREAIYRTMTGDDGQWDYIGDSVLTRVGSRVLSVVGFVRSSVERLLWLALKLAIFGVVLTFSLTFAANVFGFARAMVRDRVYGEAFVQVQ